MYGYQLDDIHYPTLAPREKEGGGAGGIGGDRGERGRKKGRGEEGEEGRGGDECTLY